MSASGNQRAILKKGWQSVVGEATYEWLGKSLKGVKDVTNRAHHDLGPHFSRFDAQMIIAISTALIAFAAHTANDLNL